MCYLENGIVKSLLQEERLVGEKNFAGFPERSLTYIIASNNLTVSDIDYFVFNGYHIAYPSNREELLKSYRESHGPIVALKYLAKKTPVYSLFKKRRKANRMSYLTELGVESDKIRFVEHHLAHGSAAYYGAPWVKRNEEVLILTQDGSGDGLSGTVSIGKDGKIKRIADIKKEDSLGRLYANITFLMGMVPLEHEYKLMGMAPYAPKYGREKSYKVFKEILEFSGPDGLSWKRRAGLPPIQRMYPYLRKKTELQRFDWIAAGIQKFTEQMLVQWVKNAIKKTGIKKVVLSGGTFMNVKANQLIHELPEVEKLFVFPSCGDETNAIGAAWNLYHQKNSEAPIRGLDSLYHGPDVTKTVDVLSYLEALNKDSTEAIKYEYFDNIEFKTAELLAAGEIVARCKGPMEFGARGLGNRSILSPASDPNKIAIINNMVKKRDFWMPFAPVMLKERVDDYIINPKKIDAPYMILTFDTTDRYKEFIGGVQQVDRTARPQVIDGSRNPDYYKLLKRYEEITGSGVMINTSFNLHGLPIVYGPKEALHVFQNSGLEYLALGNFLVSKKD